MITVKQLALIIEWPLYVTDEGRVSCNKGGCDEGDFLWRTSSRRIDLDDFLTALYLHADGDHP